MRHRIATIFGCELRALWLSAVRGDLFHMHPRSSRDECSEDMMKFTDGAALVNSGMAGQGCSINQSTLQISEGATVQCGENVEFTHAHVTVRYGASLVIGNNCKIVGRIIVEGKSRLEIGDYLVCNDLVKIRSYEGKGVFIGNGCLFANPTIYNSDYHGIYDLSDGVRLNRANDIIIEDNVWLSLNSMLLKGARIGSGSVVGAGAVVSGAFPGNAIIAGNPARTVRENIRWTRGTFHEMPAIREPFYGSNTM